MIVVSCLHVMLFKDFSYLVSTGALIDLIMFFFLNMKLFWEVLVCEWGIIKIQKSTEAGQIKKEKKRTNKQTKMIVISILDSIQKV